MGLWQEPKSETEVHIISFEIILNHTNIQKVPYFHIESLICEYLKQQYDSWDVCYVISLHYMIMFQAVS